MFFAFIDFSARSLYNCTFTTLCLLPLVDIMQSNREVKKLVSRVGSMSF